MSYFKHETAIIDLGAKIGEGTKIWHWSHISADAKIGQSCSFGQNVFVANHVRIGDRCKVQNNVSIYEGVSLEEDVFCGPSMVFTNVINPRSNVARRDQYKKTLVQKGATIGANATILCGVTLGAYCFVAAGAVVTKDVKNFALVAGLPSKPIGWMSRFGERIDLPIQGSGEYKCPHTGDVYKLENEDLILKD